MQEAQLLAIAGCGDLSLDILAFSCISKLADTTDSHFDVEGNYSKWLQNVADFAGSFFKRYPNVDITPIFTYLIHMIRDEQQFTLAFVLHTIIKTMFGWQDIPVHLLKADQLELLASGDALLTEGTQNGLKKNLKAMESLEKLFWGPHND